MKNIFLIVLLVSFSLCFSAQQELLGTKHSEVRTKSNANFTELYAEVDTLNTQMATESANIDTLQADLIIAEADIDTLETQAVAFDASIDSLRSRVTVNEAYIDTLTTKVGVYATLDTTYATEIDTANVFQLVEGAFTNNPSWGFTADSTGITLTETNGCHCFLIYFIACYSVDRGGATISFGIWKNDEIVASSIMSKYMKYANEINTIPLMVIVSLEVGDRVSLVCTTDGTDTITNYRMQAALMPMFPVNGE